MKKSVFGSLFAAAVLAIGAMVASSSASAAPVVSYGALPGAGTYYGSGNFDANWTQGAENGIVLGLGFKNRATFALLDGSSGTYYVPLGLYAGGGGKEYLSYQFSVDQTVYNTNDGNQPVTYRLCIDHDPSLTATAFSCVDPATKWGDNKAAPVGFVGFQNSENVGFGDTPGGAFDPTKNGTYDFTLAAFQGETLLDFVSARVQIGDPATVPEPAALALVLAGLTGAMWRTRRRYPDMSDDESMG
jgi:hypothetical protein